MTRRRAVVLIPAFQPDHRLTQLLRALSVARFRAIIVVDDGSGPHYSQYFDAVRSIADTHVLTHDVNLGKGAALKTGFEHASQTFPECCGVVTADADGQHHPDDILKVADILCADRLSLVLGVRTFDKTVPFRSRVGNQLTRIAMLVATGQRLSDTQTGLRGIPCSVIPVLVKIRSMRYEFELEMLTACKHNSIHITETKIRTIYIDGNRSSHFNPLLDSLKIYFTLFRFGILSMLTALLDNLVFYTVLHWSNNIAVSQVLARAASVSFNYSLARRAVFISHQQHRTAFPKYLALVIGSGIVSYALIRFLCSAFPIGVLPAKIIAESMLFLFNFAIQRDWIFQNRRSRKNGSEAARNDEVLAAIKIAGSISQAGSMGPKTARNC